MTNEGFECYKLYLALQRHFSTTYDAFKYNFKVKVTPAAYSNRNDMWSFEKLTKIVTRDQLCDFFVAHFLEDPKMWIRNMSKPTYDMHMRTMTTMVARFKTDLDYMSQIYKPYQLVSSDGNIPLIHRLNMDKKIATETIILLDHVFPFLDQHQTDVKTAIVFPAHIQRLIKYRPFITKRIEDREILVDYVKNSFV